MSTDLGAIPGRPNTAPWLQGPGLCDELHVTRFHGGVSGPCVQLTIGDQYVQLDAEGRVALVEKLTNALPLTPSRRREPSP